MPYRRRRRRTNWPYVLARVAILLFPILYVIIEIGLKYYYKARYFGGVGEAIGSVFDATVILWGFAVGACLGSFLNVVALRTPRGETIGGGSYCPYCCVPIRSRDNVPILGWLSLRGRCYACRLPIPPRYMIIEIIAGVLVGAVVWVQGVDGGINLPLDGHDANSPARLVMRWDSLLVGRTLYHVATLLYLMTAALVVGNRLLLPMSMIVAGWVLTAVPPLLFPKLLIYSWKSESLRGLSGQDLYLAGVATLLAGAATGLLVARATLMALYPNADPKLSSSHIDTKRAYDWIWQMAWIGVVFGWQGVLGVGLMWCLLLAFLYPLVRRWDFPLTIPPALLFVAALIHLLLWNTLVRVPFWPGGAWGFWSALTGLLGTLILARLLIDSSWQVGFDEPLTVPKNSLATAILPSGSSQDETELHTNSDDQ